MKNENRKERQGVHPVLRGGQSTSGHRFSKSQMDALVAICDTIFPSVSFNSSTEDKDSGQTAKSKLNALETYYGLSASDAGVPLEAACVMTKIFKRSQVFLVILALWLFSTRLGTLLLGGRHALTSNFPFVSNFAGLPAEKREKVLIGLSQSWLHVWQEIFKFFKCFVCWIAFTKVDEYGRNCTYEAMDYKVGEGTESEEGVTEVDDVGLRSEELYAKPQHLLGRLVDAREAGEQLGAELARMGLEKLASVAHLRKLRRQKDIGSATSVTEVGVRCDAAVVGSGPGGAVVAARLAERGYQVIVLEKGEYFQPHDLSLLEGPSMYAMYEESGCLVTDDSRILLMAGSTVGGGSTVNWSASFRTPSHVRNEWAHKHQLDLFSTPAYDLAMDVVCHRVGVQSDVAHENFQNSVLRRGCTALGYHVDNIPRNSPPDHQCGFCGLGCKQGKKQGATLTWLDDAAGAGAVLVVGCNAEEVLTMPRGKGKKGRVVAGVVAQVDGKPDVKIYVEARVVVAACGALRTPPLLRRSGLRNPAIGRNLHIHPVQVVWGYFPEGFGPEGVSYRGGIMTAYSTVSANWSTTGYGALLQCPAVQPGIIAIAQAWTSGRSFKQRMQKFGRTAFVIALTRDQGSGSIDVDSENRLCVKYTVSNVDKESSRHGAEQGLRVLAAAGAAEVGTSNSDGLSFSPNKGSHSRECDPDFEEFLAHVRAKSFQKLSTTTVSAHQMGSCRMGSNPSTSAVDPRGQTWEVQGLFVADSSVFPTATGVNPMITVQSIAYCTAQSIIEHLQQQRRQ